MESLSMISPRLALTLFFALLFAHFFALGLHGQVPPPTMPVSEIMIGMKGQGRTVFKGGKIDRFDFEVLGIQKNYMPGRDLVLIKASGGPLAETGIMQGMSGSPCYIDGKLIGALSIGFEWQKEPIGGVTPIQEMLDQLQDVPDAISSRTPLIPPRLSPSRVIRSAQLGEMIPLAEIIDFPAPANGGRVLPIQLFGSEFGPEAQACWDGLPVRFAGAMASGGQGEPSPLEPGGMAAITLIQGDINLAAAGTITYISGKKILLLGHQFLLLGPVDLPLWSASVSTHVASYRSSNKMAHMSAPIGAIRLDRPSGVAGIIGAEPRLIPLRVGLNLGGKRNFNFSFDVIDHPAITPALVHAALTQTILAHVREIGVQSLSLQGNIKISNHQPISIENMSADLNSGRLPMYLGGMLQAIYLNPFERPTIEGISVSIKGEERLDLTAIAGLRPLTARVKRGQTLPILVTLQNIQGIRETATLNVPVPLSAKPGKALLQVGDGLSLLRNDPDSQRIRTTSLAEMVMLLNGTLKNNYAYAFLTQAEDGAGLRGNRIEGIPPSIGSLLLADGDISNNRLQRRVLGRAALPLEREVTGLLTLEVMIE
jgi:hypothetical protein